MTAAVELVQRAPASDAFDRLYADHHGLILRYVTRLIRDELVAEDLAQDTFLRAWRARAELAGMDAEHQRRWLYLAARHAVIDHTRRHSNRACEPLADLDMPADDDPAETAIGRVLIAGLGRALAQLTRTQQQAVTLRYLRGQSIEQTAEAMCCTGGSVRSATHYGLRHLADALAGRPMKTGSSRR